MLMLTVKNDDCVLLGDNIKIRFVAAGTVYKLAVDAPKDVRILRQKAYGAETETDYVKSKKRYAPARPDKAGQ
jgi:carbon storage regulator CsrA